MDIVLIIFLWLLYYAGPAALVSLPIVLLGRRRVRWHVWELLAFIAPFCVWLVMQNLFPAPSTAKGWNNLAEPLLFAPAVPLVAAIRTASGKGLESDERVFAAVLQAIPCAMAVGVHFFTPNLGGHFHI